MVILHDDAYYESRRPQPDLGALGNFKRFVWDAEKKSFLGRTAKEWGQLGVFYLCFFTVLIAIFAFQMWVSINFAAKLDRPYFQYPGVSSRTLQGRSIRFFRSSVNFGSPGTFSKKFGSHFDHGRYSVKDGLVGSRLQITNFYNYYKGISFKPSSPLSVASPLIWVNDSSASAKPKRYIRSLTDFLQEYKKNMSLYDPKCGEKVSQPKDNDIPCFFDVKRLGICNKPPYGYVKPFQPCILIKFNKRFDWTPKYYNQSSILPEDMPQFLKNTIRITKKFHIWLSCDGANNVDKEHIGEIGYIPGPGFPIEFFPFTGQADYLSPIIALRFKNLTPNRLVTVECILWAFNIEQHSRYSLDFQLMIDN